MKRLTSCAPACLLIAAFCWMSAPVRAEAAWSDALHAGLNAMRSAEQTLRETTEKAIVIGGVLLYRHRHMVAGAALGCVAGSLAGATSAAGAGLATAGASVSGVVPACRARLRPRGAHRRGDRTAAGQRLCPAVRSQPSSIAALEHSPGRTAKRLHLGESMTTEIVARRLSGSET